MRYLVTGGAGFIGSNFIHYLLKNRPDSEIINLDKLTYCGNPENLKSIENDPRYTFVKGDICDFNLVDDLMGKVDIVVNFAADTHVDRSVNFDGAPFIQTDVYGTYVLLTAAKKHPNIKRFHQISTDEVYGDIPAGQYAGEDDKLRGSSPYAASKAGGDLQAIAFFHTYDTPVTITRCTNNYGPYQYPEKLVPLFITNAIENRQLPLYDGGTQIRDWLYVDDHCEAVLKVLEEGEPGEIYNVGACQNPEVTNCHITERILELSGNSGDLIKHVKGLRPGHDQRYAVDITKIRKIGWKPLVDIEAGLEMTFKWYRDNHQWWEPLKSGVFKEYYRKHYKMEL